MAGRNDFSKNETLMKIAAKRGKVQTKVKISNTCHFERSDQVACKAQPWQNSYCHFEPLQKATQRVARRKPQRKIHLQRRHTFVILSFRTKRKTSIVILSVSEKSKEI